MGWIMALSDQEQAMLLSAGRGLDLPARRQALGIYLRQHGDDQKAARKMLGQGYLEALAPSFHLVPRGDKLLDEDNLRPPIASWRLPRPSFGA